MSVYDRLQIISKAKLLEFLREALGDELLLDYASRILGTDMNLSALQDRHIDPDILIDIAEMADEITSEHVEYLLEQHRYSGMKTVYIYSHGLEAELDLPDLEQLQRTILDAQTDPQGFSMLPLKYRDLRIRGIDQFEHNHIDIWEIVYTYVASIETTDPESELRVTNDDLRFGFVWINIPRSWLAISAKDESITNFLAGILIDYFGRSIFRLRIPQEVIISLEGLQTVRRASHEDARGIRKRTSGASLALYEDELLEIRERNQSQLLTSSGYDITLPDGTTLVLSYNGEKGFIYIRRDLPTSQLREFLCSKITDITEKIKEVRSSSPEILTELAAIDVLAGRRENTKLVIEEIARKIIEARQKFVNVIELDLDFRGLSNVLNRYFTFSAAVNCIECHDRNEIQCNQCGGQGFQLTMEGIQCTRTSCAAFLTEEVTCSDGHSNIVASIEECINLYPKFDLISEIEDIIYRASTVPYNRHEEVFFIRGQQLHLSGSSGQKTVLTFSDVAEFAVVSQHTVSEFEFSVLETAIGGFQEKCSSASLESCTGCVSTRVSPNCLMRLFGLFEQTYTPRPHHGHEFGDVAIRVTIYGQHDQQMIILLKKRQSGRPVRMDTGLGREILSQFVRFITDPTVDVVAIGIPQSIEESFQARLQHIAANENKKLMLIGAKDFARLASYVMNEQNLNLEDL